jgi:hypothetical protein
MDSYVNALAIDKSGNLYAGGYFTTASGKVSTYIAKCNLSGSAVLPDNISKSSQFFPSYNAHYSTVNFTLASPAQVKYQIYTLSGRRIYQASQEMNSGNHAVRINTGNMSRGIYILHFITGNESMRMRLAVKK